MGGLTKKGCVEIKSEVWTTQRHNSCSHFFCISVTPLLKELDPGAPSWGCPPGCEADNAWGAGASLVTRASSVALVDNL